MLRLNVLISDPSRFGCELLKRAIEHQAHQFTIAECATRLDEILHAVRQNPPDVILLSANLEDGHLAGFRALRELRELQASSRIIVLLDESAGREAVIAAFRGGARGVFVREQPVAMLCKCIQQVNAGQIWAGTQELDYLLEAFATAAPLESVPHPVQLLTPREKQIAELVVQGFSNREISHKLNLSQHTIKNYLFRIFDKLGLSSRVELAMYMVQKTAA